MPSRSKQDLNVTLVTAFEQAVREYERLYPEAPQPFLTCTYRSDAEQEALFAKGRTEKGSKVTNARAGQSPHNFKPSFAFDIAFIGLNKKLDWSDKLFKTFADIIKRTSPSVEWGGDWSKFKDLPHYELKGWKNLAR
jgi:peptidoglycan L-alanyl-D-glutamate endopeptidase CwlK